MAIRFESAKAKELLAYLVDCKGAYVSMAELAGVLWDGVENEINAKSYVRKAIQKLLESLRAVGCEGIVNKRQNGIAIVKNQVSCDFYDLLDGVPGSDTSFTGEYMRNYSWAEYTTGNLIEKTRKSRFS